MNNGTVEPLLADTCQEDTSLLRTPTFSPTLVISIHIDLCDRDTSQFRTAVVSPKGVLNRGVSLSSSFFYYFYNKSYCMRKKVNIRKGILLKHSRILHVFQRIYVSSSCLQVNHRQMFIHSQWLKKPAFLYEKPVKSLTAATLAHCCQSTMMLLKKESCPNINPLVFGPPCPVFSVSLHPPLLVRHNLFYPDGLQSSVGTTLVLYQDALVCTKTLHKK
jgi:hypothetical protein